jgi:hypothetical protein
VLAHLNKKIDEIFLFESNKEFSLCTSLLTTNRYLCTYKWKSDISAVAVNMATGDVFWKHIYVLRTQKGLNESEQNFLPFRLNGWTLSQ